MSYKTYHQQPNLSQHNNYLSTVQRFIAFGLASLILLNLLFAPQRLFAQTSSGVSTTLPTSLDEAMAALSNLVGKEDAQKAFTFATNFAKDLRTDPNRHKAFVSQAKAMLAEIESGRNADSQIYALLKANPELAKFVESQGQLDGMTEKLLKAKCYINGERVPCWKAILIVIIIIIILI